MSFMNIDAKILKKVWQCQLHKIQAKLHTVTEWDLS